MSSGSQNCLKEIKPEYGQWVPYSISINIVLDIHRFYSSISMWSHFCDTLLSVTIIVMNCILSVMMLSFFVRWEMILIEAEFWWLCHVPVSRFILIVTWKRWEKPNTSFLGQAEVSILYLEYGCCPCQYHSTRIDTIVKRRMWFWITPKNRTSAHAHCCKSHGCDRVYLQGYRINFPISLDIMYWVCSRKRKKQNIWHFLYFG